MARGLCLLYFHVKVIINYQPEGREGAAADGIMEWGVGETESVNSSRISNF